ncbi:MAG: AAA family ATPase [Methanoregulaceae archaeon]|jgi:dephospho-CoA kinase
MKVIGVVGLPASGKGEFAKIAARRGIPIVIMGDVIRAAVKDAGMTQTDLNMGAMANKLRENYGMDAIADLCIPKIETFSSPLILVDGIRGDAEVKLFRKHFPGFILIAIDTSFATRLSRLAARGRSDDTTTELSLRTRDDRELSWGLGAALEQVDYRISNDGDLLKFTRQVNDLLQELESTS